MKWLNLDWLKKKSNTEEETTGICAMSDEAYINKVEYESEYLKFLEQYNKITGNDKIFNSFEDKLVNYDNHEHIKEQIIALNSLAHTINDNELKAYLYEKIIDELIIYSFILE